MPWSPGVPGSQSKGIGAVRVRSWRVVVPAFTRVWVAVTCPGAMTSNGIRSYRTWIAVSPGTASAVAVSVRVASPNGALTETVLVKAASWSVPLGTGKAVEAVQFTALASPGSRWVSVTVAPVVPVPQSRSVT